MRVERIDSLKRALELAPLLSRWAKGVPHGVHLEPWWLLSWWETAAERPFGLLVLDGERPLGAGFFEVRKRPLSLRGLIKRRELVFLAQGPSDFADILVAPGANRQEVVAAIFGSFGRLGVDRVNLEQIPEVSPNFPLYPTKEPHVKVLYINTEGEFKEYLRSKPWIIRRDTPKKARRLARKHRVRYSAEQPTPELVEELRRVARLTPRRSPLLGPRGKFFERVAERAKSHLRIYTLRADGWLISYRICFLWQGVLYDWSTGYDPGWADFSPGRLLLFWIVEECFRDPEIREFNFMRGDEEYKKPWATGELSNYRVSFWLPTLRVRLARLSPTRLLRGGSSPL